MARGVHKLSALAVTRASKPNSYLSDGGGLYLRVGPTGAKSWAYRFRVSGRLHEMGLGPLHTVSLAEAREQALAKRKLRLDGVDPIAERRQRRHAEAVQRLNTVPFREAA